VLSVLSRSPSPIQDLIEDTKIVSSDALNESEEEFVQVQPLMQKVHIKKTNPERIASTFAKEALMIKMLKEAVLIKQAL
jgi:hypothetical protein